MLPAGCPFVIGGGLIRDAILGGRPSDIDVWLPSNIEFPDVDLFKAYLLQRNPEALAEIIFTGPGAHTEGALTTTTAIEGGHEYGDVNNHWVLEVSLSPTTPNINIMRSMTRWTNPQDFFNGLMRAFDIDHCMFFIGYMPGQQTVNTVIMPQHMVNNLLGTFRNRAEAGRFNLNSLYWNKYRLDNTSHARIEARIQKMMSKYYYRNLGTSLFGGNLMERIGYIETEQIIATPVQLSTVMRQVNSPYTTMLPLPMSTNALQVNLTEQEVQLILNRRA